MTYVYPAVFTWYESEKVYLVSFPDADNWFTEGSTIKEAIDNAADVLNLMLWGAEDDGESIPQASRLEDIKVDDKNSFAQYIYADTELYKDIATQKNFGHEKKK